MQAELLSYIQTLGSESDQILDDRKLKLDKIVSYLQEKGNKSKGVHLIFICTHNSRRSHLSQIWAQVLAVHYGWKNVFTYSGGTEATAVYPQTLIALEKKGFKIVQLDEGENPRYMVMYDTVQNGMKVFSKKFADKENPNKNFAAVMTCMEADEACPFVPGAEERISLAYEDPKAFDGTPEEAEKYSERSHQIAVEMNYVFSRIED